MTIKKLAEIMLRVLTFWDTAPCTPYVNRCFGGIYHFHLQGRKSAEEETGVQKMAEDRGDAFLRSVCSHTDYRTVPRVGNIHNYRCENHRFYRSYVAQNYQIN
jgi:hypothetical protein